MARTYRRRPKPECEGRVLKYGRKWECSIRHEGSKLWADCPSNYGTRKQAESALKRKARGLCTLQRWSVRS